jgi:hypothetical protein
LDCDEKITWRAAINVPLAAKTPVLVAAPVSQLNELNLAHYEICERKGFSLCYRVPWPLCGPFSPTIFIDIPVSLDFQISALFHLPVTPERHERKSRDSAVPVNC